VPPDQCSVVAEIGDVHRLHSAGHLCPWPRLTPRHRQSDTHIQCGNITKQGFRLWRWAAVEAVSVAVREPMMTSVKPHVGAVAAASSAESSRPVISTAPISRYDDWSTAARARWKSRRRSPIVRSGWRVVSRWGASR
jgi:hypothetical protein